MPLCAYSNLNVQIERYTIRIKLILPPSCKVLSFFTISATFSLGHSNIIADASRILSVLTKIDQQEDICSRYLKVVNFLRRQDSGLALAVTTKQGMKRCGPDRNIIHPLG